MMNLKSMISGLLVTSLGVAANLGCDPVPATTRGPVQPMGSPESGEPGSKLGSEPGKREPGKREPGKRGPGTTDHASRDEKPDQQELTGHKGELLVNGPSFKNELVEMSIEGVCRITEDSVACWNFDGGRNDELAKEIEAGLTNQQNRMSRLQLQYGKKNRALVVKSKASNGVTIQPARENALLGKVPTDTGWNGMHGTLFNAYSSDFSNVQTRREVMMGSFQPDEKFGSYRVEFSKLGADMGVAGSLQTVRIEAKANTKFRVDDVEMLLKSIGSAPGASYPYSLPTGSTLYQYVFDLGTDPYLELTFQLLDGEGKRIFGITKDGKPRYHEETPSAVYEVSKMPMRPYMGSSYYSITQMGSKGDRSMILTTPLGPTVVKKIIVSYRRRTVLFFNNIPLDPK